MLWGARSETPPKLPWCNQLKGSSVLKLCVGKEMQLMLWQTRSEEKVVRDRDINEGKLASLFLPWELEMVHISPVFRFLHIWARKKAILLAFCRAPLIQVYFLKPQISVYCIPVVLVHCCTWHGAKELTYLLSTYRWESRAGNTICELCFQLLRNIR